MNLQKNSLFLNHDIYVDRGNFLNEHKTAIVFPAGIEEVTGGAIGYNINNILKASLGEYLERLSLSYNAGRIKGKYLNSINLLTGETFAIEFDKVLLNRGQKIFQNSSTDTFNDSCGVSFHYNSQASITSAFLEFFERQSLIFNWLSQSKGEYVEIQKLKDRDVQKIVESTYNYIDEIYLFNISLHKRLYVILTLGFGKFYFGVGIKASPFLKDAIKGSILELFHSFSLNKSKYHLSREENNSDKEDNLGIEGITGVFEFNSKYWGNTTSKNLKNDYNYLFENYQYLNLENESQRSSLSFKKIISEVSSDLGIDIYCCFIPSSKVLHAKVVKIYSDGGFPHMNTQLYHPLEFKISSLSKSREFPNAYKKIPFP